MAKSAPARHLATKYLMSVSGSGERGCSSGNAATPTQKSPDDLTSRTSSSACRRPRGCGTHSAFGSPGGSPRSTRTLRTSTSAYEPITCLSSATEWLTAVRWPTGVSDVWTAILPVTRTVRSLVEPPAPYVTETKVGFSGSSCLMARHSCCSSSCVFGGMNSNENDFLPALSSSEIKGARPGRCVCGTCGWWAPCTQGTELPGIRWTRRGLGGMWQSITHRAIFCDLVTIKICCPCTVTWRRGQFTSLAAVVTRLPVWTLPDRRIEGTAANDPRSPPSGQKASAWARRLTSVPRCPQRAWIGVPGSVSSAVNSQRSASSSSNPQSKSTVSVPPSPLTICPPSRKAAGTQRSPFGRVTATSLRSRSSCFTLLDERLSLTATSGSDSHSPTRASATESICATSPISHIPAVPKPVTFRTNSAFFALVVRDFRRRRRLGALPLRAGGRPWPPGGRLPVSRVLLA